METPSTTGAQLETPSTWRIRSPAGKPSAPGAAGLSYCRGGPRDPGQVIAVSPVEPTQQAIRSLR